MFPIIVYFGANIILLDHVLQSINAFAHCVFSSLSTFTHFSSLNSNISTYETFLHSSRQRQLGNMLHALTELIVAIALVIITCSFLSLFPKWVSQSQNQHDLPLYAFIVQPSSEQLFFIIEKITLLNKPFGLWILYSKILHPSTIHIFILLCFRHRKIFTTLNLLHFYYNGFFFSKNCISVYGPFFGWDRRCL